MTAETTCHRPNRWWNPTTGKCEHTDHDMQAPQLPVLPLPGDSIQGRTVIASIWMNDEAEEPFAQLLLLRREPPYYELVDVTWKPEGPVLTESRLHPNIVPAVEDYQQSGGDY